MWNHPSIGDAQHLAELPILPLTRVVLLPGMTLPVNLHTPADCALVDHVRSHGDHLGVPLALQGAALPHVFTLARLLSHVHLAGDRRLIRVEGLGRVETISERPQHHLFREFSVRPLGEPRPQDRRQLDILRAQVERILVDGGESGVDLRTLLNVRDDRVFLYALTACLPVLELLPHRDAELDLDELAAVQQQCLAAATADDRAAVLVARTAAILGTLTRPHHERLN